MSVHAPRHLPAEARKTYRATVTYLDKLGAWSPCYRPLVEVYARLGWLSTKITEGIVTALADGKSVPPGLNREYVRTARALDMMARALTLRPRPSRASRLRPPLRMVAREALP